MTATPRITDHQTSPAATDHRPPTILVVDDSLPVRRIIESTFARCGIPVHSFTDGIAAIRALMSGDVAIPDIVLLDITMPKMDGYEVARVLRSNPALRAVPIVMLTGRDGVVDRVHSHLLGARAYITKPFVPSELVTKVCECLGLPVPSNARVTHV